MLRLADNLSCVLQRKGLSAAEGHSAALLTCDALSAFRSTAEFNRFWLECMYCLLQLFIHWCIIILCLVAKLLFIIIALFISSSIVTKYLFILDALL